MCNQCQKEINDFRNRNTPSPWQLDRQLVADRLLEIIYDPDSIDQAGIGFCPQASFLWVWVRNDHLAVVRFAIELYETGKSAINDYEVEPCEELLACDYNSIQWVNSDGDPVPVCPPTDWMLMGALLDAENAIFDFEGSPTEWEAIGSFPNEIVDYLEATGLYTKIENDTRELFPRSIDHALALRPDQNTDVIMAIDASLLGNPPVTFNKSNHLIGLIEKPRLVNDNTEIEINYFTWGYSKSKSFPITEFEDKYYGAIIAEAKSYKKVLPSFTSLPDAPTNLTARLDDSLNKITVSWKSTSMGDSYYFVDRAFFNESEPTIGTGNWEARSDAIYAKKPSTLGGEYKDIINERIRDSFYWYRVLAVNPNGASDYSSIIMVSWPSGETRLIDTRDVDIRRPPSHIQQVIVVRALSGLEPTGFAKFFQTEHDCLNPQIVYDASWQNKDSDNRTLNITQHTPFKPNRDAYIFIRPLSLGLNLEQPAHTIHLTLKGIGADGHSVNISVEMSSSIDDYYGAYYWGVFTPENEGGANYELTMEFQGSDAYERYIPRNPSGHAFDSNPSTRAYADLDNSPLYPFQNYEPGSDKNHKLTIGQVFEQLGNDNLEPNDSFDQAKEVSLVTAEGEKMVSIKFDELALSTSHDVDYFPIKYESSPGDNNCTLLDVERSGDILGIFFNMYPPMLGIEVYTDHNDCVDLVFYNSQKNETHRYLRTNRVVINNPTREAFADNELYLAVRNSDYNAQGAFHYNVTFSYAHAHAVIGGGQGYSGVDVQRWFFRRLCEALDLVRPGEIFEQESHDVIRASVDIMVDPQTRPALHDILKRDVLAVLADNVANLTMVTKGFGMKSETTKLLRSNLALHREQGNVAKSLVVAKDLEPLLVESGDHESAITIRNMMKKLQPR